MIRTRTLRLPGGMALGIRLGSSPPSSRAGMPARDRLGRRREDPPVRSAGPTEWGAWLALAIIAALLLGHGLRIPIQAQFDQLQLARGSTETRDRGWDGQPWP